MRDWQGYWQGEVESFKARCFKERDRFLSALASPLEAQKTVLDDIVSHMINTQFGREHGFSNIHSVEDFQAAVPIRYYDGFLPWIEKEVEEKQGNLSQSPLLSWLKTSGSTGNSKKIPYTERWMSTYRVPALCVLWANYLRQSPDMLLHAYATMDTQTVREETTDFLNGVPYQGITNRDQLVNEHSWNPPWYEAPWFTADVPEGYDERMYYRLRYFLGQDLRAILTINPSTLVAMQHHLLKNFDLLINDIRNGTVMGKPCEDPKPILADRLNKLRKKENFTLKDLWPNLSLISCWTSASAKLYLSQLEAIFPNTSILPFMTCGTEGIVTLPIDEHSVTGPLAVNQGFYEFLPADVDLDAVVKSGKPVKALLFNELEINKEYHLIMTQGSGMCRYAVGDIFKVTDFYNGVPRIEFSQRHGTYHSFTGEKLTEQQLMMVIEKTNQQYDLSGGLFMFCPTWEKEIPHYKLLLESDCIANHSEEAWQLQKSIDVYLCDINEEFASKRHSDRLGAIEPVFVPKGTVNAYIEDQKKYANAIQYKYKPFQKNDEAFNEILSIAERESKEATYV